MLKSKRCLSAIFQRNHCFYQTGLGQKQPSKVFCKNGVLKNLANFTEKHLCWSLFLIKLRASVSLLKRGSNTSVFLWNLRNFSENLFFRTSRNNCFCQVQLSQGVIKKSLSENIENKEKKRLIKTYFLRIFRWKIFKIFKTV